MYYENRQFQNISQEKKEFAFFLNKKIIFLIFIRSPYFVLRSTKLTKNNNKQKYQENAIGRSYSDVERKVIECRNTKTNQNFGKKIIHCSNRLT